MGPSKFAVTPDKFQWYEDGTEAGASAIGSESQDIASRNNDSDSKLHLRIQIQEDGAGSVGGASTDDWQLQRDINDAGTWADVNTTSTRVQTDIASQLTDDGATTDRLSGGAGTFFGGIQEEGDGEVTDFLHQADNFTQHVWALVLIAADNSDADHFDFRVRLNGGAIGSGVEAGVTVTIGGGPAGPPAGLRTLALTGAGI